MGFREGLLRLVASVAAGVFMGLVWTFLNANVIVVGSSIVGIVTYWFLVLQEATFK